MALRRRASRLVPFAVRARRRQRARVRQREYLAADALHQMRNAVATLGAQATVARRATSAKVRAQALVALEERLQQLGRFLVLLEQLESRTAWPSATPASFNLTALAHAVLLEVLPLARSRGVDLGWVGDIDAAEVWAQGSADALREAIRNVLENVVQHTPAGGAVDVTVGKQGGRHARLHVVDHGPGVEQTSRNQVFARFFRGAHWCNATFRSSQGLGLSIAHRIVMLNHGNIRVFSDDKTVSPNPGSHWVITLILRDNPK